MSFHSGFEREYSNLLVLCSINGRLVRQSRSAYEIPYSGCIYNLKKHVTLDCHETHASISLSADHNSGCQDMVLNTNNNAFQVFLSRDAVEFEAQPVNDDVTETGEVVDHSSYNPISTDGSCILLANSEGPMSFTEKMAGYENCFKMLDQQFTSFLFIYTNAGTLDNPIWVMDANRLKLKCDPIVSQSKSLEMSQQGNTLSHRVQYDFNMEIIMRNTKLNALDSNSVYKIGDLIVVDIKLSFPLDF